MIILDGLKFGVGKEGKKGKEMIIHSGSNH